MATLQPHMQQKPSFMYSLGAGLSGYVKGALAGGILGVVGGGVLGAIVGLAGLASGGSAFALLAAAGMGAAIGGSALASIGSIAGAMTGVVKSREAHQPSANDIVNVAKVAFAQGVGVGQKLEHEQHRSHHVARLEQERNKVIMPEVQSRQ